MADLADFSDAIAHRGVASLRPEGEEVPLSVLASLDAAVRADGATPVHMALRETLLRLCETHILANPRFLRLVEVWDNVVGTAHVRIGRHLEEMLAAPPSQALIEHIFRCLSGSAARHGRQGGHHQHAFEDILERLASGEAALRCECCGYHFRSKDLSRDKLRTVVEAGLRLESSLFPGRASDPYKPIQWGGDISLTQLSIDHVVPQETLGWSDADNLELLCMFCNHGKLAYRRPLEALSSFAVGALAEVPRGRKFGRLKHQIVVAALRAQGGECCRCQRTRQAVELTVRPVSRTGDGVMQGFAPWNLRTICYACVNATGDEGTDNDASANGNLSTQEPLLGIEVSEDTD